MKKVIAMLMFSAWQASATAADASSTTQAEPAPCETTLKMNDRFDLRCPLEGADKPVRYRFKVTFSGGHDDTKAELLTPNDDPLTACDAGSKVYLFGEEGDVSLECNITVPAKTKNKPPLELRVKWTHCDYAEHSFTREAS